MRTVTDCASFKKRAKSMQDAADTARVEQVASDLERMTYEPIFLLPVPGFLRMRAGDLIAYADHLCSLSDEELAAYGVHHMTDREQLIATQLSMLLRNFRLLVRLRDDIPEAWDEIHELYEDD